MSKGKDFRAPRKRGFDDDGPMSYDSRPRPARGYGGAPDGSGFGGAPMGGTSSAPISGAPPVDAVVKWFKADKGYGFVELAGGQGDAFLHANALHAAGHESVPSGAKLRVQVGAGSKGAQVTRVLEVDTTGVVERPQRSSGGEGPRPRRMAPDPSTAVSVTGKVKWFDEAKGFGFVASEDGGKDIFVHISILGPAGISQLAEGQQVTMRVVDTPKGREAISLSL
jgi:cold shock protein